MRALLGILLLFGAICAFLLVFGTGIGVITIGFTSQLFARISSMPLDDPIIDPTFAEPFTPERITY